MMHVPGLAVMERELSWVTAEVHGAEQGELLYSAPPPLLCLALSYTHHQEFLVELLSSAAFPKPIRQNSDLKDGQL